MDHPLASAAVLERLTAQASHGRLPNSLLFVGPEGCGMEATALGLARHLLGAEEGVALHKFERLVHPDLHVAFAVESKLDIAGYRELLDALAAEPCARIRQPSSAVLPIGDEDDPHPASVRAVRRFAQARPFEAAKKVAIIVDAHRMNRAAANALLKTLEEPPAHSHLLLTTDQPHLLPATIPSRCARINMPHLGARQLAGFLQARHGVKAKQAEEIALLCDGNARRALDLLDPQARDLAGWGSAVAEMLLGGGRRAELLKSAELIAKAQAGPKGKSKSGGDASLSASRDVGMRVLDYVVAELIAELRDERSGYDPSGISAAIRELLRARADLARYVNVALTLSDAFARAQDRLQRQGVA